MIVFNFYWTFIVITQVVALKFISKIKKPDKEVQNLRREIEIMRSLRHPNIVEMLDSFDTDNEIVVVTEFAHGELFQILQDDRTLPEDQVSQVFININISIYSIELKWDGIKLKYDMITRWDEYE